MFIPGIRLTWWQSLALLLFFFGLSQVVRSPNFDRPLSQHHEFTTAVALRIISIWQSEGIGRYGFNPVMTYPRPQDKYINNHASGSGEMVDADGNYYYVSHPPLAYYAGYFWMLLQPIKSQVLWLQVLSLLLNFISVWLLYLVVRQVTPDDSIALLAGLFYLFNPATLWFQMNTYMADMFIQPLFLAGVFFMLRNKPVEGGVVRILGMLLLSLLMIYSTWFGWIAVATWVALSIIRSGWRWAAVPMIAGGTIGAAVLVWQYASIAGFDALLAEWSQRFGTRSWSGTGASIVAIIKNYFTSFFPVLMALAVLAALAVWQKIKLFNRQELDLLMLLGLPVIVLHLLLPNYSGHDFVTLYAAPVLAVAASIIAIKVLVKWQKQNIITMIVLGTMILSIIQYQLINKPGEFSYRGANYGSYKEMADKITAEVPEDAVLFISGLKPEPQLIYYVGRNIRQAGSMQEARDWLEHHNPQGQRGVMIYASQYGVERVEEVD